MIQRGDSVSFYCFFVQYVFNVTKSIRNCRLVSPPGALPTAVIPSKLNRTTKRDYDKDLYKARHLIENFFAKLKQYRALATRYDKLKVNFLGAIYLAATVIWLN